MTKRTLVLLALLTFGLYGCGCRYLTPTDDDLKLSCEEISREIKAAQSDPDRCSMEYWERVSGEKGCSN